MQPKPLLHKCRSSGRLHRLVCDHMVWLHLLKQTVEFSKEKLEVLVNFVPENRRSELMPEVVRAAARKFPSSDPGRGSPVKIIWTVQGFDAPETMDMEGYMEGYTEGVMEPDTVEYMEDFPYSPRVNNFYSNVEKLKDVAKAVRIDFTILEVQGLESSFLTTWNNLKMIVDHVEQQDEKLANFEMIGIGFSPFLDEVFFSLQRLSKKWKVKEVGVDVDDLEDLAASSLDNGHIVSLSFNWYWGEPVNLNALQRVWEISDEMEINGTYEVFLKGGRGEDCKEAWQSVIDFFLRVNGNNND